MIKGQIEGMIRMYHIENVAMVYECSYPDKVFYECRENIKKIKDEETYHQYCNNLDFLIRINSSIISNKDYATNYIVRKFLLDIMEHNFDYTYCYNWQELKSILFYCIYMSKLKNIRKFSANLESQFFRRIYYAYIVNDSIFPERKIHFQKLLAEASIENKKKIKRTKLQTISLNG